MPSFRAKAVEAMPVNRQTAATEGTTGDRKFGLKIVAGEMIAPVDHSESITCGVARIKRPIGILFEHFIRMTDAYLPPMA